MTQEFANQIFLELRMRKINKITFTKGFEEFEKIYEDWKGILERTEENNDVTIKLRTK